MKNTLSISETNDVKSELIKLGKEPNAFDFDSYTEYPTTKIGILVEPSEIITVKSRLTGKQKTYKTKNGENWIHEKFIPDVKMGLFD